MKISIVISFFYLLTAVSGQNYKNVVAYQDGLSITVKYDMSGELFRGDQVALTFSIDGGKSYSFIKDAEGDLGSKVLPGKNNEINWLLIDKDFIVGKILNFRIVTIPEGMAYVDGGQYTRINVNAKKNEKSEHTVALNSYLIDKTEVTQRI